MGNIADKPSLAELTEREFDLRVRMDQLSQLNSVESEAERVRVCSLYAQAKADLDAARKALQDKK